MATNRDTILANRRNISVEQVQLLRETRALTDEGVEALPETTLQRSLRRIEYPDMPRQRIAFRLSQAGLLDKAVHENALTKALNQLYAARIQITPRQCAGVPVGGAVRVEATAIATPPPVAGLAVQKWKSIGPGTIGGRTRAILVHPTNPDTIWLGSVGGGIWQTTDAGGTWFPADDFMSNLAVTSLVMDPTDNNVIYAGTGEGFGNLGALRGAGIFRTVNGIDWAQIGATDQPQFQWINRLAISSNGAVLLAATNSGIYRSDDPARQNWSPVLNFAVADVKFHPTDAQKAVAGSLDSGRVWRTRDGGLTWLQSTHSGGWSGRVEVCYAVADPDTIYASININNGQIWRSANGGRTFTPRRTRNPNNLTARYLGDQGWYDNVIWAGDMTNKDLVLVGGIDLWRSTNGGHNLDTMSTWWDSRSAHADHHSIVAHPNYNGNGNRTVFFGNDGGIYRADDIATVGNDPQLPKITGWSNLNSSYGVTQFYGGTVHPTSGVIVCGAQDNGTLAFHPNNGANAWKTIFGGDGGYCAADPTNQNVFYGEYVYLNIHRNTDGATTDDTAGDRYISGQFWNAAIGDWDWKPVPFRIPDAFNQRALFIAPFLIDPNSPQTLLAGGESLWRTTDALTPNTPNSGPTWSRIKPPANDMISAVAIDPNNSDHVWIGHRSGEIWQSGNATAASPSWNRINGQGNQPVNVSRYCHQIAISPHDPDMILVAFGGYARGNIWRSNDRGGSWINIGTALPEAPIRAIAYHPGQSDWIYAGSEVGIFSSDDLGQSWSPTNEGPANVSVEDLIWSGETLICITHGRGVFTIDLS